MEGKIQVNSGDVSIIAIKVDNKDVTSIPKKSEGKRFDHADCSNGATGNWDSTNWRFLLSGLEEPKTKCTLYFLTGEEPTGGIEIENKIQELVNDSYYGDQIFYEQEGNDNNIRFIGSSPYNYVTFNGEPWRIIGLMDNVVRKDGTKEKLLKIIREYSLGEYSWDSSAYEVNDAYGVNEWSEADLMYALKKYGGESVSNCGDKACPDWTTLKSDAQNMVEEVVWNTGTMDVSFKENESKITPLYMYSAERSTNNGKQCLSSGNNCNDGVVRKTTWTGKVGLMYPSDYGYATSGGHLVNRKQCLEISMYNWNMNSNCSQNDWLLSSSNSQWTMTSVPDSSSAGRVFNVYTNGSVKSDGAYYYAHAVRPVVYLKSNVKISGGDGSSKNPYTLSVQ